MGTYRQIVQQLQLGGDGLSAQQVVSPAFDVSEFRVIKFVPYVVAYTGDSGNGGKLWFETSPTDEDKCFRPMMNYFITSGLNSEVVFFASNTGTDGFDRYVRWKLAFSAHEKDITFDLDMIGYYRRR